MTTKEAFKQLISKRGWYHLCGIQPSNATSLKHLFLKGKLSMDKQFKLLETAGYKVGVDWYAPVA